MIHTNIIHGQTKITTTFWELDEHGNITQTHPVSLTAVSLTPEVFAEALAHLQATRNKLHADHVAKTKTEAK